MDFVELFVLIDVHQINLHWIDSLRHLDTTLEIRYKGK